MVLKIVSKKSRVILRKPSGLVPEPKKPKLSLKLNWLKPGKKQSKFGDYFAHCQAKLKKLRMKEEELKEDGTERSTQFDFKEENKSANIVPSSKQQEGQSDETIQFAGFLSDFDPTLLFVLTYSKERHVSYLKVLKIEKKEDGRSYSVYEE